MRRRAYSMEATSKIGDKAVRYVEDYLNAKPETIFVANVEDNKFCQAKGIDLLWQYQNKDGALAQISIEVKCDRYFKSNNYFFETVSNSQTKSLGWFLYSEADFLYYYFLDEELHIIPLPATQEWFRSQVNRFSIRRAATANRVNPFRTEYYSYGHLVDRKLLKREVKNIIVIPVRK